MSLASPRSWSARLYLLFTGLCMGAADVVPGVSGGTMAFVMGVYEDLLDAIHAFNVDRLRKLLSGRFAAAATGIPWTFLFWLVGGIVLAILSLVKIVKYLFEHQQSLLFAFFFGLIVASIVVLARGLPWNARRLAALAAGSLIGYLIVTLSPHEIGHAPLTLFGCGAIAIMAMILPGISGSFLLLVLGQYAWVLEQVDGAMDALRAGDFGGVLGAVWRLMPLALGAVVGLLTFARVLRWVLQRYHGVTVAVLIGFMVGSLRKIWPWMEVTDSQWVHGRERVLADRMVWPGAEDGLLPALGLMLAGVAVILLIEAIRLRRLPQSRS